ncbi:hypothetical protein CP04DC42_0714B, partial [Chlamydia psittaci 04DC42]
EYNVSVILDL